MKLFIYQGNDHDCGFASLKMFLANLSKDKSYLYIPKPKKKENYTLTDIVRIAKEYGMPLECYGCNKESYSELDEPSLTLIDENHMVMIKKISKKHITLYDPGRGIIKMKKDEFLRRWRCVTLTTNYPESANKIKRIRHDILPRKLSFIETSVALLSVGILIGTFYLLNNINNYLFSFIFLGLFILFQFIEKTILYKQVYIFDKKFIPLFFNNGKNNTKQKYKEYVEYKQTFFTFNRKFIASILTAFLITFLLCFNDFRNVFILLTLILVKLLEKMLFAKCEEDNKNVIAEYENNSFSKPDEMLDLSLKANIKADKEIFFNSIKDIVYISISFLFSLIMMFITNNTGCNYVIFHFMMYFTGFNSYNVIIDGLSIKKEIEKRKCQFFDCCNL